MLLIKNKKAKFEYKILEEFLAGLVLTGSEVKSLRQKHASFSGSYVKFLGSELFLINAQINPYQFAADPDYQPKRSRKLLLKKKELDIIAELNQQKGNALVPLSFELLHNRIKLRFAVGKGKKTFEKRETIKKRDLKRELLRKMKNSQLKI